MIHAVDSVTSGEPRASTRQPWVRLENSAHKTMPQTPRRNSQTTPNWAEKRYAAGAAVAALLAAYLLAGPTATQRAPIPPGATLITGLEALAPPRPKGAAPLGGKWPLDVLLVPGYERPPTCEFPTNTCWIRH